MARVIAQLPLCQRCSVTEDRMVRLPLLNTFRLPLAIKKMMYGIPVDIRITLPSREKIGYGNL